MILVAGSSFTATVYGDRMPKWHDHLVNPKHRKFNLATAGAGNIYIGESVKKLIGNKIRACLIMWNHLGHLDVATDRPKIELHLTSQLGGKFWNHYGNMASGRGKSDWKRLGYEKVIQMNLESIQSTHKALDQLGIPYAYSFSHGDYRHTEDMTKNAIKPYIGDWAVEENSERPMLMDDNYHANAEAHRQWSDLARSQISFKELIS